ncbi:hypothetical protein [Burkholderia gladioli]|uniref:hypothetical protein n=1 Tax=Burkholderia gladioli TaxID=28095 RepID=UPI00163F2245|nr:hypothetical protein [Burkholderia gladioli]
MNDPRENLKQAVEELIGPGKKFSSGRELAQRAHTRGFVDSAEAFSRSVNRVKNEDNDVQLSTITAIAKTAGISAHLLLKPREGQCGVIVGENSAATEVGSSMDALQWIESAPSQLSILARSLIVEIVKADRTGLSAEGANALLAIIRPILENKPGASDPPPGLFDIDS